MKIKLIAIYIVINLIGTKVYTQELSPFDVIVDQVFMHDSVVINLLNTSEERDSSIFMMTSRVSKFTFKDYGQVYDEMNSILGQILEYKKIGNVNIKIFQNPRTSLNYENFNLIVLIKKYKLSYNQLKVSFYTTSFEPDNKLKYIEVKCKLVVNENGNWKNNNDWSIEELKIKNIKHKPLPQFLYPTRR